MTSTPSRRGKSLEISSQKKKTKFKHNATKVVSTGRTTKKTLYWDQRSGSWKSTKNKPIGDSLKKDFSKTTYKTKKNYELKKKNVNKESNEKLKIISQARKDGNAPKFGDIRGTEEKPKNTESNKESSNEVTQNNNKLKIKASPEAKQDLKDQASDKFGGKLPNKKKDPLADYRRGKGTKLGKDTKITKSLKKSGFTEDRLAGLRKKNAEFQSIKKIKDRKERKKKMEAYRSKYGK